jgi:hypothetical protein
MLIVADTSPISYLILIEEVEILPKLYGRVLIPPQVLEELGSPAGPEPVRSWTKWFMAGRQATIASGGLLYPCRVVYILHGTGIHEAIPQAEPPVVSYAPPVVACRIARYIYRAIHRCAAMGRHIDCMPSGVYILHSAWLRLGYRLQERISSDILTNSRGRSSGRTTLHTSCRSSAYFGVLLRPRR